MLSSFKAIQKMTATRNNVNYGFRKCIFHSIRMDIGRFCEKLLIKLGAGCIDQCGVEIRVMLGRLGIWHIYILQYVIELDVLMLLLTFVYEN